MQILNILLDEIFSENWREKGEEGKLLKKATLSTHIIHTTPTLPHTHRLTPVCKSSLGLSWIY